MKSNSFLCSIVCSLLLLLFSNIYSQTPFVTTWQTTVPNDTIEIPTKLDSNYIYDYTVDWGDGNVTTGHTGNATHSYADTGTYQVSISGVFPAISFGDNDWDNRDKIISIDQWGTQNWLTMEQAFSGCSNLAGQALDEPNLSSVKNMSGMFKYCEVFNQDIGNWDVSRVSNMNYLFHGAFEFNQDIGSWDVSNVTDMRAMLSGVIYPYSGISYNSFNKNIGSWDVSKVIDMNQMFLGTREFNQDIGNWNVSKVVNMSNMFLFAKAFNQDIGDWDVSNITDMSGMFSYADSFNQYIGNWDVSNVSYMNYMFYGVESFNQDIGDWDVSKVTNMVGMFGSVESFNQDIGNWDVSKVTTMNSMFARATVFNQDIGDWDVGNVTDMVGMFYEVKLSTENYDSLLVGWSSQNLQSGIEFDGGYSTYCEGESARQSIIDNYGWIITDDGKDEDCITSTESLTRIPNQLKSYPNPSSGIIRIPRDFPIEQLAHVTAWDALGNQHNVRQLSERAFQLTGGEGAYHLVFEMKNGQRYIDKVILIH